MEVSPAAASSRVPRGAWPLLIVAATFLVYLPVMNGGPLWDDDYWFVHNPAMQQADGLRAIWFGRPLVDQYYPLTLTSLWIQWQLFHEQWWPYHLLNVALHATSAILIGLGLERLRVRGAWFAAALFALHPVQVESVAWMCERKNVLSGAFFVLGALVWWRFEAAEAGSRRRWGWYLGSVLCLTAALLSKATAATLPFALALIGVWRGGRVALRRLVLLVPHACLAIGFGWYSASVERSSVGANGPLFTLSLGERFLILGRASWFYLSKLLLPIDQAFIYPRWTLDTHQAWQWLFPLGAALALGAAGWARSRVGAGPLVAFLFFGGVLFPALGFFNVYPFLFSFVADHFQYLACIGPLALVAHAAAVGSDRFPRSVGIAGAALVLLVLGGLTASRAYLFADTVRLWQATLEKNPDCWMCESNLGKDLSERGRPEEAIPAYQHALRTAPVRQNLENDLGVALLELKRPNEAEQALRSAIRDQPNHVTAWINLGDALLAQQRADEAKSAYGRALQLRPISARGNTRMGSLLMSEGQPSAAAGYFRRALATDPAFAEAKSGLAQAEAGPRK